MGRGDTRRTRADRLGVNAMDTVHTVPNQSPTVLLEADHLVKRFGDFTAVQDLSLQVSAGEVLGLLGPNGAGKTTTISMCIGLLHPTSGCVRIAGHDVVQDAQAVKSLIGYVP